MREFLTKVRTKNKTALLNKEYMRGVEIMLSKVVFFVTETEDKDPFYCEGLPVRQRQRYMRETRLIELLCDALHYPFSLDLFSLEELTANLPITRTCRLIYRILRHSVKDYRINEEYVAQWIDLFFH